MTGTGDLAGLIRAGLSEPGGRDLLLGEAAPIAAVQAHALGVTPAALWFLAEVVRRGGIAYAAELPEPLPGGPGTELARSWLAAAESVGDSLDRAELCARWLDAVALLVSVTGG
ncbi:hypothetical protein [Catellatospora tritici]|uniref:hypothetical protein n=1 Tax=Catellatospora tritici TaxID=2851566 RepID=UPI001C2D4326|nr:hypothetical protein [Catellatospora tritici]MBV1853562.1 hypothetical protein [Catellatospora tritici]